MNIENIPFYSYNTIVVGSGAAGYNAALSLHKAGETSVAIVTEGRGMGTSRNTGSDKQTYYKLTTCGSTQDSVYQMAETLFSGGAVDGDVALAEAAGSLRAFYQLVDIGVPFPHNESGEFVGYKTDHDPLSRGSSAGPFTSKMMTELLEQEVLQRQISQFDGYQAIKLLVDRSSGRPDRAVGILTLNKKHSAEQGQRYAIFAATNIIWATGGEAGLYKASVYPTSQSGGMGVLLEEGVRAKNLTESQYGIASTKFRWNLSGTFQQCLPRYVSTDVDGGDECEFLEEFFTEPTELLNAIFLKGYQWPFDARKAFGQGSSLIDLLIYREKTLRQRRVFLDFSRNPHALIRDNEICFNRLPEEAMSYLANSGALQATPYDRLLHMNPKAIAVYSQNHIDLANEYLEIDVCAQHGNGGIAGDAHWETCLSHLFAVGEVNGSHGVYRPGGSALNAGQVGSLRAAQYIHQKYGGLPVPQTTFLAAYGEQIETTLTSAESSLCEDAGSYLNMQAEMDALQTRMSQHASFIRSTAGLEAALAQNREQWQRINCDYRLSGPQQLKDLFKLRHLLVSQYVHLRAILDYVQEVGFSRGSYLVYHAQGELPDGRLEEMFRNQSQVTDLTRVQEITYDASRAACRVDWRDVRPLPKPDLWFETVWKQYRERTGN